jgi:lantibiotic modifying enzyme
LAGLSIDDSAEIRLDIERAIQATRQIGLSEPDHLCCGNMGRLEFLHMAATASEDSGLHQTVLSLTGTLVKRASEAGTYSLGWTNDEFSPGLFQGYAGIGYQLLRFAKPGILPSVLAFEAPGAVPIKL